jgi:hypothetical protein
MARSGAAERWRGLLGRQAGSGLSVAEFCRRQDVSQPSFYQWRKRLRGERPGGFERPPAQGDGPMPAGNFLPLSVVGAAGVEVELPCGALIHIPLGDARTLEQVITLLMRQEAEPA